MNVWGMGVWLYGCMDVWLYGVWVCGWMGVWMYGWMDGEMQEYKPGGVN